MNRKRVLAIVLTLSIIIVAVSTSQDFFPGLSPMLPEFSGESRCGNLILEYGEQCDPPGSYCTSDSCDSGSGTCNSKCKCIDNCGSTAPSCGCPVQNEAILDSDRWVRTEINVLSDGCISANSKDMCLQKHSCTYQVSTEQFGPNWKTRFHPNKYPPQTVSCSWS